jgi:hypothetical protein
MSATAEEDVHAAADTENSRSTISKKKNCIRFGKLFSGIYFSQDDTKLWDINIRHCRIRKLE